MNLTEQIQSARFGPAKKDAEPSPKHGIKRFGYILYQNFWRLIGLNLLFLLFCLPIVTIPASLCGLNRVLIELTRQGHTFIWSDFIKEFKANLLKSLPFGLFSAFFLFDSALAFYIASSSDEFLSLPTTVGLFILVINVLFSSYVFVLLPSLNANSRDIARNAFVLMMSEWKTDLIILAVGVMAAFIVFALFPFSLPLLLLIWFSFVQLAICVCVNEPMQRRIVGPYEEGG